MRDVAPEGLESQAEQPDASAVVAVSRLQFRSPWLLVQALLKFRRLYKTTRAYPGFVRGQVSVAGPRTLVNVSLWRNRTQMMAWSGTDAHVNAVHWSQRHTLEVWSADARMIAVSASSHRWTGAVLGGPLSNTLAPSGRPLAEELEASTGKKQA